MQSAAFYGFTYLNFVGKKSSVNSQVRPSLIWNRRLLFVE